jgi:PPP family 3-phenylpropionic acid transporter
MSKFWPFLANVSFFACVACFYPFLILYYQQQGFSGPQIGLLTSLTPLMTLLGGPLWTNLADRTRQHRLILAVIITVSIVSLAALPLVHAFLPVVGLIIVLSGCFSTVPAFIDSATMTMLGRHRELYGQVRLGGTLGYAATALLMGVLVQHTSLQTSFWTGAGLLFVALFAARYFTFGSAQPDQANSGSVRTLLADRRWWPFLTLVFAGGLSLAVSTTYILAFMKELHASGTDMGLALTAGAVMEVPMMLIGHRLLARYKAFSLVWLGIFFTGLRLLLYALVSTPAAVVWLQLLNGITYPLAWLAGVAYAHDHAPAGLGATAQGLFGAVFSGFGAAVGNFAGGLLLERWGGHTTYLVFGLTILGIALLVALITRLAPVADQASVASQN